MSARKDIAAFNHKSGNPCSAAVLKAFSDEIDITDMEAAIIARPFAGGRMIKCGAVLAAEYVLRQLYPDDADEKCSELERRFLERNSSVTCRELKGKDTGIVLRSCRGCVTDAAEILEEMLSES